MNYFNISLSAISISGIHLSHGFREVEYFFEGTSGKAIKDGAALRGAPLQELQEGDGRVPRLRPQGRPADEVGEDDGTVRDHPGGDAGRTAGGRGRVAGGSTQHEQAEHRVHREQDLVRDGKPKYTL